MVSINGVIYVMYAKKYSIKVFVNISKMLS